MSNGAPSSLNISSTKRHQAMSTRNCNHCIFNEKACSKTLPSCQLCQSRGLVCHYNVSEIPREERRIKTGQKNLSEARGSVYKRDRDFGFKTKRIGRKRQPMAPKQPQIDYTISSKHIITQDPNQITSDTPMLDVTLPNTDLLDSLHRQACQVFEKLGEEEGQDLHYTYDSSALLALGYLVEEVVQLRVREALKK